MSGGHSDLHARCQVCRFAPALNQGTPRHPAASLFYLDLPRGRLEPIGGMAQEDDADRFRSEAWTADDLRLTSGRAWHTDKTSSSQTCYV
jgi:hypothetical protein